MWPLIRSASVFCFQNARYFHDFFRLVLRFSRSSLLFMPIGLQVLVRHDAIRLVLLPRYFTALFRN